MREILFRAKPCYRGGEITPWVYGTFRHLWGRRITPGATDNGRFEKRQDKGCINGQLDLESEVLCDTLGEFTGCYDKKHNRIFEGDIVECVSWNEYFTNSTTGEVMEPFRRRMYVEFRNGGFKMVEPMPRPMKDNVWDIIYNGDILVIGNIYDNPELLKKED